MDTALTNVFLAHRVEVLKKIAADFSLDEKTLLSRYGQPDEIKMICIWKSNRGGLCKNPAMCGYSMCTRHYGKAAPKQKRVVMVHTHKIGQAPDGMCMLCEMYGDPLDANRPVLEMM